MLLEFRKFKREDFPDYLSWFQDKELSKYLGPMQENDEWLQDVLNEQSDSIDYSIFSENNLVAVVGLYFPQKEYQHFVISTIAVKPTLRGQNIGRSVIEQLLNLYFLLPGQSWLAFIDQENSNAFRLFAKCGWVCLTNIPDANGMYLFEYK